MTDGNYGKQGTLFIRMQIAEEREKNGDETDRMKQMVFI